VYKTRACEFADTKASALGDYIPTKLGFDEGERAVFMVVTTDYSGWLLFFFENGKAVKLPLDAYVTKTNRRKLVGAYNDKVPLVAMFHILEDGEFLLTSSSTRMLLVHSGAISVKTTRTTQGIQAMTLKAKHTLTAVVPLRDGMLTKPDRYRTRNLPATGALPAPADVGEQLTLKEGKKV
jgi:DNA gyrase subunit A